MIIIFRIKDNRYRAIIEQDEDGVFVASVPSVPGCHSQGDTFEQAVVNIKEALDLCLEVTKVDLDYRAKIDKSRSEVFSIIDIPTVLNHA